VKQFELEGTAASSNKVDVGVLPVMLRCCDVSLLLAGRGGEEERLGGMACAR
jgi:hypothetical protein